VQRAAETRAVRRRYRGGVANKPRNRGGTGSQRAGAANANAAKAGTGKAGTAQLIARPDDEDTTVTADGEDSASPASGGHETTPKRPAYPGQGLGLPERGPMSVASTPSRLLALLIDWLLSMAIAYWLTHSQYWTIVVFAVEVYVLTALTGVTVGKRLCGIRVIRTNGGRVGFGWALVRLAILLTVVLPLLTDGDLRGVHDRAADTIVVRI
jgi:RDD family